LLNGEAASHSDIMGESVLVVRPGALGDTILTLPLLASIRSRHPSGEITFLGNSAYRDLLPPGIRFGRVDDPRVSAMFDSGWPPGPAVGPAYDHAYVILKKPEHVIENLQRSGAGQIRHVSSRVPSGKHIVEHLHEGLGLHVPPRRPALARLSPEDEQDLIWVHPGSGGQGKCVGVETMMSAARTARDRTGWRIAVTVGEADGFIKEDPYWEQIIQMPEILVLENRPLLEICRVLGGARLFLGNDSGISHLAAGLGIGSVIVYKATDPYQWGPWVALGRVRPLDFRGFASAALDNKIKGLITSSCLDLLELTS